MVLLSTPSSRLLFASLSRSFPLAAAWVPLLDSSRRGYSSHPLRPSLTPLLRQSPPRSSPDTSRRWYDTTSAVAGSDTGSKSTTSWWSRWANLLGTVLASDDRINPQRMLERRYLYLALTLLRFRDLQQIHPDANADNLRVQAVQDLQQEQHGGGGLDDKSNAELRLLLHEALAPQVMDILHAVAEVDAVLGLDHAWAQEATQDDNVDEGNNHDDNFMEGLDWSYWYNLLQQEAADTRLQWDQARRHEQTVTNARHLGNATQGSHDRDMSKNSGHNKHLAFLQIKRGAIDTLLHFLQVHGIGTTTATSTTTETPTWPCHGLDYFGMNVTDISEKRLRLLRQYQVLNMARSAMLRQHPKLGYSVLCLQSTLADHGGGRGVFVDGMGVTAGSLLAFQPGDVWPKEHLLTNAPDVMAHFDDGEEDCQTSLRFDEYVLDSRTSPVTILTREGSCNPWALGHMVNHPPPDLLPNAQSLMLNFTERMQLNQLARYIPNVYARPPGWQSRAFDAEPMVMHSLCLLARRPVGNEEIFYDYRLQSHDTPEWYHPVVYGDNFLDQEHVVFFRDDWKQNQKKE